MRLSSLRTYGNFFPVYTVSLVARVQMHAPIHCFAGLAFELGTLLSLSGTKANASNYGKYPTSSRPPPRPRVISPSLNFGKTTLKGPSSDLRKLSHLKSGCAETGEAEEGHKYLLLLALLIMLRTFTKEIHQ